MEHYFSSSMSFVHNNPEFTIVEVSTSDASGFVGSTGYIDRITVADFASRRANVLIGEDPGGRKFISTLVCRGQVDALRMLGLLENIEVDMASIQAAKDAVNVALKPRVLTLFQRYVNRADLFVTAGDVSMGNPSRDSELFYMVLGGHSEGRYKLLPQEMLKPLYATAPAVPAHKEFKVDSYHLDGTIGVINL